MATSPDPVTQAAAYQQLLLSLLGQDDPAAVQGATAQRLKDVLNETGADLRRRPAEGEWSILELLGHIVDAELVAAARYRWILCEDQPALIGYDQDRWVSALRHNEDTVDELLELFEALRAANRRLWERTSDADRRRVGMHAERGPESVSLLFRMLAGHDRFHLNQMRETLTQLRER
jgi:DinB superfamily